MGGRERTDDEAFAGYPCQRVNILSIDISGDMCLFVIMPTVQEDHSYHKTTG